MHALLYPGPSTQQKPTLERQTSNATLRVLACSVLARGPENKEYSLVDRLIRTILGRNQLKLSLLPPQLRRVIELRFDYQNTRGDTQVAGLLKGSVDEVRAWTLMAFKRMRELGPTDAHRAELDRRLVDHAANPDDVVPWDEVKDSALTRIGR
jgi:Putative addiction module component